MRHVTLTTVMIPTTSGALTFLTVNALKAMIGPTRTWSPCCRPCQRGRKICQAISRAMFGQQTCRGSVLSAPYGAELAGSASLWVFSRCRRSCTRPTWSGQSNTHPDITRPSNSIKSVNSRKILNFNKILFHY